MSEQTQFVIFAGPRTGSTYLEFKPGPALSERIAIFAEIRRFLLNSRYRRFIEPEPSG